MADSKTRYEDKHSLFWFDAQPLAAVHIERSRPLAVPVSFRAVLFAIAGLAVDLLVVDGQRGAV